MHFRFFGDSWFWTWNWNQVKLSSKELTKIYQQEKDRIPLLQILLERMGHSVETHNHPANPFTETVNIILEQPAQPDTVNVVFYSADLRQDHLGDFINQNAGDPYHALEEKLKQIQCDNLTRLALHAHETNQKFILAGGQSTVYKSCLDTVPHNQNLHILSEHIISQLGNRSDGPMGMFALTDITGKDSIVEWQKQHESVVNQIHSQMLELNKFKFVIWPDSAHMNSTGVVVFLDWLFQYLEDK